MDKETVIDSINNTKNKVQSEIDKKGELHKLNTLLKANNEKITTLYIKLGKALYDEGIPAYSEENAAIKNKENEIQELKKKMSILQGYQICGACGEANNKEALYCIKCGKPLKKEQDPNKCPNCGKEINEKMLYCSFCGTKLKTEDTIDNKAE